MFSISIHFLASIIIWSNHLKPSIYIDYQMLFLDSKLGTDSTFFTIDYFKLDKRKITDQRQIYEIFNNNIMPFYIIPDLPLVKQAYHIHLRFESSIYLLFWVERWMTSYHFKRKIKRHVNSFKSCLWRVNEFYLENFLDHTRWSKDSTSEHCWCCFGISEKWREEKRKKAQVVNNQKRGKVWSG